MKLYYKDDDKIRRIIQSVEKDPASWEGWHCIALPSDEAYIVDEDFVENILCKVLDLYLEEYEGQLYTHSSGAVYIFSRGANYRTFVDVCVELAETYQNVFHKRVVPQTFDLFLEGVQFARMCRQWHQSELPDIYPKVEPGKSRRLHAKELEQKRKNINVLLVDDDRLTHALMKHLLDNQCAFVDTVVSGEDALESYLTYKPDIVFLDINLEHESGHDVLNAIKEHDSNAYIVMFSGSDTIHNIAQTLEAGANGFVAKPFRKEKLIHYINTCPSILLH